MIDNILQTVGDNARALIRSYCKWERRRPVTQNDADYLSVRDVFYKHYLGLRKNNDNQENAGDPDRPMNATQAHGLRDIYEDELLVMAEVSAYHHVASKRVVDMVRMVIENEYIQKFVDELEGQLVNNLRLWGERGEERCRMYLSEDEATQRRRLELIRKKQVLESAADIMRGIVE